MAIGEAKGGNVKRDSSNPIVIPASCKGIWLVANDDLEQTVPATPLNPATIADSTFHWIKVPEGSTRCILRAQYTASATVTTDPIVRVIGAYPGVGAAYNKTGDIINEDGSFPNDGTIRFMRLDLADTDGTGITLDLVSSGTGLIIDAASTAKAYSDPTSITPIDLLGAWYVGVVAVTAANVNTGVVACEVLFVN